MPKYRIVFRRASPSAKNPLAERAFAEQSTDQPNVCAALAFAYSTLAKTRDESLLSQVVSVNVREERTGAAAQPEGGAND